MLSCVRVTWRLRRPGEGLGLGLGSGTPRRSSVAASPPALVPDTLPCAPSRMALMASSLLPLAERNAATSTSSVAPSPAKGRSADSCEAVNSLAPAASLPASGSGVRFVRASAALALDPRSKSLRSSPSSPLLPSPSLASPPAPPSLAAVRRVSSAPSTETTLSKRTDLRRSFLRLSAALLRDGMKSPPTASASPSAVATPRVDPAASPKRLSSVLVPTTSDGRSSFVSWTPIPRTSSGEILS
mmetsp:Transcript_3092/g.12558  ORF Transcript_3092/g.12558 Transcript_3092/m.12558 type:complete len:243 (+) Transcript_3092:979-1707(+)